MCHEPELPVADEHAHLLPSGNEPLLELTADAVEHRELMRIA